jgi:hypothetical protein
VIFGLACKETATLDKNRLDVLYFVGEYKTDYLGIQEILQLKIDGKYNYRLVSNSKDTIINDIGSWKLLKTESYDPSIYFENFPNIRLNKVQDDAGNRTSISFNLKMRGSTMGDLEAYALDRNAGEGYYTFIKLDRSKNREYIVKSKK